MERASPETFLADNCLVPACGPCSVDLSDNPKFFIWISDVNK